MPGFDALKKEREGLHASFRTTEPNVLDVMAEHYLHMGGPATPSGPVVDSSPPVGKNQRVPYQRGSMHLRNALWDDGGGSTTPVQCTYKLTSGLTLDDK